jgi:pyruvate/2-oxoglutarate dehydrogenase complex dihydrolipoamide dehydrogenase (E3) component
VVEQTCKGIEFLMKKNKVDVYNGHGSFVTANKIAIIKADGSVEEIETDKTISGLPLSFNTSITQSLGSHQGVS